MEQFQKMIGEFELDMRKLVDKRLSEIAENLRSEILLPYCQKNKFVFQTFNQFFLFRDITGTVNDGEWFAVAQYINFYDWEGNDRYEVSEKHHSERVYIDSMLRKLVDFDGGHIGFWVEDIKEEEL